jgi:hypothetical protein
MGTVWPEKGCDDANDGCQMSVLGRDLHGQAFRVCRPGQVHGGQRQVIGLTRANNADRRRSSLLGTRVSASTAPP